MGPLPVTLTRFILEKQAAPPGAAGEFSALMAQIGLVGKMIAQVLRRAGLVNVLGVTGEINVQGEAVKKLDELANEELEKPVHLPENWPHGRYVLLFDPLDGSSNTDVNMPLGTIVSVLRHEGSGLPSEPEMIRKGTRQVAACYLLYGSSTMLVFTAGQGVQGFTLDPGVGEYLLSHENIRMPRAGKVYSANEGNSRKWPS